MDEIKRPIQARDLGVTDQKIENPQYLYFKGLNGKDYSSPEALQRDEQAYREQQIKPREKIIINEEKLKFKKI